MQGKGGGRMVKEGSNHRREESRGDFLHLLIFCEVFDLLWPHAGEKSRRVEVLVSKALNGAHATPSLLSRPSSP